MHNFEITQINKQINHFLRKARFCMSSMCVIILECIDLNMDWNRLSPKSISPLYNNKLHDTDILHLIIQQLGYNVHSLVIAIIGQINTYSGSRRNKVVWNGDQRPLDCVNKASKYRQVTFAFTSEVPKHYFRPRLCVIECMGLSFRMRAM